MLPAIFVSHGSPMLAIENAEARDFLKRLPEILPERPKAILMISAHWERLRPGVNAPPHHETIHDFGGFPPALYQLTYPAPPSADLARRVAELLTAGGLPTVPMTPTLPLRLAFTSARAPGATTSITGTGSSALRW